MSKSNLFIIFVAFGTYCAALQAQNRYLNDSEKSVFVSTMAANCKVSYLKNTTKLSIKQIEWICNCSANGTMSSMTLDDIRTEDIRNRMQVTDPNTKFRQAMSYWGDFCVNEAITLFKFK